MSSASSDLPLAAPKPRRSPLAVVWHIAVALLLGALAYDAAVAGLDLRRRAWDDTMPIRFSRDVSNGFRRGITANEKGYTNLYDKVEAEHLNTAPADDDFAVDYPPLRLWAMMRWARWVKAQPERPAPAPQFQKAYANSRWQPEYEFTAPMLNANTAGEAASALAAFFLVRLWIVRRGWEPPRLFKFLSHSWARPWYGCGRAFIAAMLVWFNAALIWNGHAGPQWDGWVLPFFLWAALLASLDLWFWAGVVVGIGAMFKGQMLAGAPVLVLWPLFGGKLRAAVSVCVGAGLAVAVVLWPWLTRDPGAMRWLMWCGGALAFLTIVLVLRVWLRDRHGMRARTWLILRLSVAVAAGLGIYPLVRGHTRPLIWSVELAVALLTAGAFFSRRRHWPVFLAGGAAVALWLCAPLHNGGLAPLKVAFDYGAKKFPDLSRPDVCNLPALLAARFGWSLDDPATTIHLPFTIEHSGDDVAPTPPERSRFQPKAPLKPAPPPPSKELTLTIKELLWGVYAVVVVLCAIGAAVQDRRRDPRVLIALVAPWVLFFALMPQMHQRYLVWGAALTALAAGVNGGLTLLHLVVTAVAWGMQAHTQLRERPQFAQKTYNFLQSTYPDTGWLVLLCAAIFLYFALMPRRQVVPRRFASTVLKPSSAPTATGGAGRMSGLSPRFDPA